jgi:hypothetical protein
MFGLGKNSKRKGLINQLGEKLHDPMADRVNRINDRLKKVDSSLSERKRITIIFLMLLIMGLGVVYVIYDTLNSNKKSFGSIGKIETVKSSNNHFPERDPENDRRQFVESYLELQRYDIYFDSLSKNHPATFDSLMQARPHLIDSLNMLREYVMSNQN